MKGVSGRENRSFSRMGDGIDLGRTGATSIPQGVVCSKGRRQKRQKWARWNDSTMRGRAGGKHRFTFGRKRRRVKRVEPRKRVARRENARCIGSARETSTPSISVRSVGASIGSVGGNRWSHVSRIELFTRNRGAQAI
jgi:hypothetical protein